MCIRDRCSSLIGTSRQADGVLNRVPRYARDDKNLGHGPTINAGRATPQCHPAGSPALITSYALCPTLIASGSSLVDACKPISSALRRFAFIDGKNNRLLGLIDLPLARWQTAGPALRSNHRRVGRTRRRNADPNVGVSPARTGNRRRRNGSSSHSRVAATRETGVGPECR